jgi:hypothetical protein
LGPKRSANAVRAEKAHHRASGGPDPPLYSGARSLGERRNRRRAERSRERRTRPHGVARVHRGSGAESSALWVQRSRQAVSATPRYFLPHRGSRTVAPDLASLNLARPFRARGRRTDVDPPGPTPPSPASGPFSACSTADSVDAGLPHPPPSVLSVSHALDGLHSAAPSELISSR